MARKRRSESGDAQRAASGSSSASTHKRKRTRVTIREVAAAAGVATSTVSRALNGDDRVSEATRRRVSEIARDLGYTASPFARALRTSSTNTLGFIAPNLENPITLTHLRAAVRAAQDEGYTIFVSDSEGRPDFFESQIRQLVEHRVDGILFGRGVLLLTPAADELLATSGIPLEPELMPRDPQQASGVRAHNPYRERADLERGASLVAFKRLLGLGHRRVAYLALRMSYQTYMGDVRRASLYEAVADAGLPPESVIEVPVDSEDQCVGLIQQLVSSGTNPTAIVVGSGVLTTGVLKGIHQTGWGIPDDVSVLVYGDSAWHESHRPPLAVIRHDYTAAAERSVQRLIARVEHQQDIPNPPRSPAEFLPRASLAPPRNGN